MSSSPLWARRLAHAAVAPFDVALINLRPGDEAVSGACADAEARLKGQGRLLVRPSGTEKLIRVMAEGDDARLVRSVVADVVAAVKAAGS